MDNSKECKACKLSKQITDFIGTQEECYKCVYIRKTLKIAKKKPEKCEACLICGITLPKNRWKYCSDECGKQGKITNTHWTRAFDYDTKDWKKRFTFLWGKKE